MAGKYLVFCLKRRNLRYPDVQTVRESETAFALFVVGSFFFPLSRLDSSPIYWRMFAVASENRLRFIRPMQKVSRKDQESRPEASKDISEFDVNGQPAITVGEFEGLAESFDTPLEHFFDEDEQAPSLPNLPDRLTCDDIVGIKRRK
jgi:hypothetical protein